MKKTIKLKEDFDNYKGYDIEHNFYGNDEYTVQYQGDDVWFETEDEAKAFIDQITNKDTNLYLEEKSTTLLREAFEAGYKAGKKCK